MPLLRTLLIKDKLAREYEGTRFVQWLEMSAQFNNKFLKCEDLKNMDKVQCVGESHIEKQIIKKWGEMKRKYACSVI